MTGEARRDIFVPARGQYENIGDILLRRQLLDWLRESGRLHVYVGQSTDGYDDGLRLQPEDVRYRSFRAWYAAALKSAAKGTASYAFKPGEIQLTLIGMKEHLSMLPVLALIRARGGAVVRVGVGSRNFAPVPRALIAPSIALSNISLWRDVETARYLGGQVMPDLAFGEGSSEPVADASPGGSGAESSGADVRDVLVVSMRSDLNYGPYPSDTWLAAVRSFADAHNLQIWTATQVHVDDEKAARLAVDLGGQALRWDGRGHDEQEERLRALYRRSLMAISDRLHVLVAAVTEGAVPAALLTDSSDKIARHFAAAGVHDITVPAADLSVEEIVARLENLLARRELILDLVAQARTDLFSAKATVGRVLTAQK